MKPFIQTLDLNEFRTNPKTAIKKLRRAMKTTGFFFLKNHGMNLQVIAKGEEAFKEFLTKLPLEKRMRYSYPDIGYQVGYTPPQVETGEFAKVADEKHFFHVFPDKPVIVDEIPTFAHDTADLWNEFNILAKELKRYIALSMGEPENLFETKPGQKEGFSLVRGIHYPEGQEPVDDDEVVTEGGHVGGMCASMHTDIDDITLLLAKEPGLQLLYKRRDIWGRLFPWFFKKRWVPITITEPDLIIVNLGDMIQHLTNGIYKSGMHRVVCEKDKERYSIPFFSHSSDDFSVIPLRQFGKRKKRFSFKTAGEYLHFRLVQIGLLKE